MSSLKNVCSTMPHELINLIMCYMSSNTNTIFKNNDFVKYAINEMKKMDLNIYTKDIVLHNLILLQYLQKMRIILSKVIFIIML